jgi:hypothetical protein
MIQLVQTPIDAFTESEIVGCSEKYMEAKAKLKGP